MQQITETQEFVEQVSSWVFKSDLRVAQYLKSVNARIPSMFRLYNANLYRYMRVDQPFIESLSRGIMTKEFTSWTKSESVALSFSQSSKEVHYAKGDIRILIKKKIPGAKIIFDVHSFALFYGKKQLMELGFDELAYEDAIKEQEIIIDKGLRLTYKDIKVI